MREVETLIIGAGPIGLETAIACRQRGIDVLQLDAGAVGQQILNFPPMTRWFSSPERLAIGGVPFVTATSEKGTREEYLAYLRAVVQQFELPIRTFEHVEHVAKESGNQFRLSTTTRAGLQHEYVARNLVIATGGTARPRRLGVPGEDLPHVFDTIGEPHALLGRRVVVVGAKNSACDAAIGAYRCGAKVTMICREETIHERVKYWIRPELMAMIESAQITALFQREVEEIEPDAVVVRSTQNGELTRVPVDDVLLAIGFESDQSLFRELGAALEPVTGAVEHEQTTMETSVANLFVAGTAVAGTQASYRVYIENSHIHARRIAAAIAGDPPPPNPILPILPES